MLNAKQDCSHQPFSRDQAFQVTAAASSANTIRIDWTIADGCYLYRNRIKASTASGVALGTLALPEGESHSDEFFGTQQIYHHTVSATLPVTRNSTSGELSVPVDVTYQGCAEIGLCYPPTTKTLNVTLPAAGAADSAIAGAATDQAKFLNPDVAFQASAMAAGPDSVRLDWKIADGYYLYRSRIKVKTSSPVQLGALALPEGKRQTDEYFGAQEIYEHALSATLPIARPGGAGAMNIGVDVTYQGCAHAGLCYPPITKTLAVTLPPAGAAGGGTVAAAPVTAGRRRSFPSRIAWRR